MIAALALLLFLPVWFALGISSAKDSAELTGQIIVDPESPTWLAHNGGGSFFLCGPGDPEGFLYRGRLLPDGTRDGDQMELIQRLEGTGANGIYMMALRTHGGDAKKDRTQNPFIGKNPANGLNQAVLDQWDGWFQEMERLGITIYFFFYDDSSNPFDTGNTVSAREKDFLRGIVNRFEYHKNLIWVIAEEYTEALSDVRASRIAAYVRQVDQNHHVIAIHQHQGLVFRQGDDSNIDQFAVQYNVDTAQELHQGVVRAWLNAAGRYNLNFAESAPFGTGAVARKKIWSIALGGAYVMPIQWLLDPSFPRSDLSACGNLVRFMELAPLTRMSPHDELAAGGTDYVLANPGEAYIAYAHSLAGQFEIRMQAGTYDLTWIDIPSGQMIERRGVQVVNGVQTFHRPAGIGTEAAVLIRH
jgi:Protein of unknown function (DUF4038)